MREPLMLACLRNQWLAHRDSRVYGGVDRRFSSSTIHYSAVYIAIQECIIIPSSHHKNSIIRICCSEISDCGQSSICGLSRDLKCPLSANAWGLSLMGDGIR
jgi:hypothetical protein